MVRVNDQDDLIQLVGFRLGQKLFGASIMNVREILRDPRIDVVDGVPAFVHGIVRVRGQVLPVLRLDRILGVRSVSREEDKTWILVAQAGKRNVGYIVDEVTPIIRISRDAVLPPPELILSSLRSKYIKGVCETSQGLAVIVDLENLLLDDEVDSMDQLSVE